jgi:hypothetical protein
MGSQDEKNKKGKKFMSINPRFTSSIDNQEDEHVNAWASVHSWIRKTLRASSKPA